MRRFLDALLAVIVLCFLGSILLSQLPGAVHADVVNPPPGSLGAVTVTGGATSAKQDTGNTSLSNLEAYVQCIRPAANTKSVTATATTSTAVDAGCSGNALYTQISNLDRTVDVVVTTPDGGSFNLGPLRTSPKVCKAGSATPDNFTVTSVDGSSIVSVVAGCAS